MGVHNTSLDVLVLCIAVVRETLRYILPEPLQSDFKDFKPGRPGQVVFNRPLGSVVD